MKKNCILIFLIIIICVIQKSFSQSLSVNISATDTTICNGESITLKANATGSSSYTYKWSNNLTTLQITVNPNNTTTYTVTVTDTSGTTATSSIVIFVNPKPSLSISPNNLTICPGTNTTLTVSGANSYIWSTGQTSSTINISPQNTTTYTVTGTNQYGCSSIASIQVNVHSKPTANFSFSPNNACAGTKIDFTNSSNGGSSYLWNFGDGSTSTTYSPSHIYPIITGNGNTNYNVKLVVTNTNGCKDSINKIISVSKTPEAILSINNGASVFFNGFNTFYKCAMGAQTYSNFEFKNDSQPSNSLSHYIDWGDGTLPYTSNNFTTFGHIYNIGHYTLTYIVENSNGCSDTSIYKVFFW